MSLNRLAPLVLAVAVLSATACTGASTPKSDPTPSSSAPAPTAGAAPATASESLRLTTAATAFEAPDPSSAVVTELATATEIGSPTTLLVVDERPGWLKVVLPIRPNGTTGWVRADAGQRRTTEFRIDVGLASRRLTLFAGADVAMTTTVAVGADETPTPTGSFSVTDLVDTDDPTGAYGPYALGLSAHSNQLTEFAGGDGQVGLHGTNDPTSIGQPVSHGCIRLPNEVIEALVQRVPLGTPVVIR